MTDGNGIQELCGNITRGIGATWGKWDLHIHTPASYHWRGAKLENATPEIRRKLIRDVSDAINTSDVRVFGIMDYWTFDGYIALAEYYSEHPNEKKKCVLPGIELRLEAPTSFKLNTHVLFSDSTSPDRLRQFIAHLRCGGGNQRPPSKENLIEIARGYDGGKLLHHGYHESDRADAGKMYELGLKTVEVTRESLRDAMELVGRDFCLLVQPYDTNDGLERLDWKEHSYADSEMMKWADIFEAKKPMNVSLFLGTAFETNSTIQEQFLQNLGGRAKPVVRGSDAHQLSDYGVYPNGRITWLKAEPSFGGLKQVCHEPASRCYIGTRPPKLEKIDSSTTKYIDRISIRKIPGSSFEEKWFENVDLDLNPGLVAIIGNKGSGKSALADIIALLGNTRCDKMEFLNEHRFRRGRERAQSFEATIRWKDGGEAALRLSESASPAEPERIRYLPQQAIENLCNELASGHESRFEAELRKVIFSHVPEEQRLHKESLDELIAYQTDAAAIRIRHLQTKLSDLNSAIATLENDISESSIRANEEALKLKQAEFDALDQTKPTQVELPKGDTEESKIVSSTLESTKIAIVDLQQRIDRLGQENATLNLRRAALTRLRQKIKTFEEDFQQFVTNTEIDFKTCELPLDEVVTLRVNLTRLNEATNLIASRTDAIRAELKGTAEKAGIENELARLKQKAEDLRGRLDAPNREYQVFLAQLEKWTQQRNELIGSPEKLGSIKFFEAKIAAAREVLPRKLSDLERERLECTCEIHRELSKQVETYRSLYMPVQGVATAHRVAKERLQLRFDAFLSASIEEKLLAFINQGRRGAFYGVDEGRRVLHEMVCAHDMNDERAVSSFLTELIGALRADRREGGDPKLDIAGQLRREVKPTEVYDFLFGLSWLQPRYTLRLGEKDISQLSPGEKGALLLVFYLLLDREEIPIVIDQPEHNLDNESVVRLLVECIKEARESRQVLIVTHNPNLAIVCDADQIICARMDKADGNRITYSSGAIEHRTINEHSVNVLEGTYPAFENRKRKYMMPSVVS